MQQGRVLIGPALNFVIAPTALDYSAPLKLAITIPSFNPALFITADNHRFSGWINF